MIPPARFSPDEMPWARSIESAVSALQLASDRSAQSHTNSNNAQAATLSSLAAQIVAVQGLEAGLQAQVNSLMSTSVNTGDVNASGHGHFAADVTAGGNATVGGILRNVAAYTNPITSSFRAVWVTSVDGQFGFNLSSREFKQDIRDFAPDAASVLLLRLVTYRYIAAVQSEGDEAELQVGLIAEEVHDLGLEWLVEYDNGKPCGIKFHLIAMALLSVAQDHETRLSALEAAA